MKDKQRKEHNQNAFRLSLTGRVCFHFSESKGTMIIVLIGCYYHGVCTCVFTPTVNLNSRSLCAACWRGKVNTNTEAAQQSHDHCCSMRTEHDKARCECVSRIFVKKYLWLILGASSHQKFTSVGLTDAWRLKSSTHTCANLHRWLHFWLILTCCCCCPLFKWDS